MSSRPAACARVFAAGLACLLLAGSAAAQYFGRNLVLWERFDFHTLRSEHFDVYHYPPGNVAAEDATRMAERWYQRLSDVFGHQFEERKPIVLYNDHADFQQTPIAGGLIGEGTGGFTEPLLDRVVLPLTPAYADTDHVIGHELVHAFQFDIAAKQARNRNPNASAGAPGLSRLPLWMVEGLAEYLSQGRVDTLTATWLRDAVLHDDLPDLAELTRNLRYNPYQYGQAVWAYIAGRWGDRRAVELFTAALQLGPEDAFRDGLGMDWEQFSSEWHRDVKAHYEPLLAGRTPPGELGQPLLAEQGGEMNIAPVLSPDGTRVAFLSTRSLFSVELYVADVASGRILRRLTRSAADPHVDALRFIESAGAWSPDGRRLAFPVVARGDNQVQIVDAESGDTVQRIGTRAVGEITSLAWSPDGRTLALAAMAQGIGDLYLLTLDDGSLRRLTDDRFSDLQPAWSPDGGRLVFASDRGGAGDPAALVYASLRLHVLELASGAIHELPGQPAGQQIDPSYSPDGQWIYFLSDHAGASDVYRVPVAGGAAEQLTRVATGVGGITDKSPALSVGGDRMVFSVFAERDLGLRWLPLATAPAAPEAAGERQLAVLPPAVPRQSVVADYLAAGAVPPPARDGFEVIGYDRNLRLSYVGPVSIGLVSDDFGYGVGGGATAFFSDTLGRHELAVALQGGSTTGSLADAIGLQALYLDRSQRLVWGGGVAHLPFTSAFTTIRREPVIIDGETFVADVIEQTRELITVDQAQLLAQFPLAQTRRFEAVAGYTRYSFEAERQRVVVIGNTVVDDDTFDLTSPQALDLWSGGVAYVGDNSSYGLVSPARGGRMRVEIEQTGGTLAYTTALADLRRYFWLRPLTLAVRGIHLGRYGSDAESPRLAPLFVGRETLVRGYSVSSFELSECTSLPGSDACPEFDRMLGSRMTVVNLEARLPLFGVEEYGLIELPSFPAELTLFVDGGVAWSDGESPRWTFERNATSERIPVVSAGASLRFLLLGALPLEFYYAKPFQRPREDWVFGFTIAPGW